MGVEQLEARHLLDDDFGPRLEEFDDVHSLIRTMNADGPNPYRPLDARRGPHPQPGGAGAAGRDRQLVRAPAGQALRRRAGGLGDGLELRGALPQRAHLPRAAADPPRRAPRLDAAVRPRSRRDGLGGRARGRGRRRPDRPEHGLPGAEGLQDRRRRGAARRPGARRGAGPRRGRGQRAAGHGEAADRAAAGR